MIIDRDGNMIPGQAWWRKNGKAIEHYNPEYDITFNICLPYTDEQKVQYAQIKELKRKLEETDYKPLKYLDGDYTEEEYALIKAEREAWRAEINHIEEMFVEPSLTPEEIAEAERKAMEKLKTMLERQSGKEIEMIRGNG